jgi:hypothetical protein
MLPGFHKVNYFLLHALLPWNIASPQTQKAKEQIDYGLKPPKLSVKWTLLFFQVHDLRYFALVMQSWVTQFMLLFHPLLNLKSKHFQILKIMGNAFVSPRDAWLMQGEPPPTGLGPLRGAG